MYMYSLFLKLSSVLTLLILTAKLLVNIKNQKFSSCLILTENFVVSIKSFKTLEWIQLVIKVLVHSRVLKLLILTTEIPVSIKTFNLNKLLIFNNMTYSPYKREWK